MSIIYISAECLISFNCGTRFFYTLMPGIVIAQSGLARSVATGRIRPSLLVHIFKRQEYDMRTGTLQ
ncbi:MAG: hypothetical protein M0R41_12650 [Methylobacter tundripaludum]|nr:hypothetical protein [Methylobacter tundripaludum]